MIRDNNHLYVCKFRPLCSEIETVEVKEVRLEEASHSNKQSG